MPGFLGLSHNAGNESERGSICAVEDVTAERRRRKAEGGAGGRFYGQSYKFDGQRVCSCPLLFSTLSREGCAPT